MFFQDEWIAVTLKHFIFNFSMYASREFITKHSCVGFLNLPVFQSVIENCFYYVRTTMLMNVRTGWKKRKQRNWMQKEEKFTLGMGERKMVSVEDGKKRRKKKGGRGRVGGCA